MQGLSGRFRRSDSVLLGADLSMLGRCSVPEAATSGRSFWILDDLSPLQQLVDVAVGENHLFEPRHAYRLAGGGGGTLQPGRHVKFSKTPMTNLYLAMLERMGGF